MSAAGETNRYTCPEGGTASVGSDFLSDDHDAWCSCGWDGGKFPTFADALAALHRHLDGADGVDAA